MSAGRIGWFALAIAAAILAFQVLLPPAVGLADNGDFGKVAAPSNLYPSGGDLREFAFRYVTLRYDIHPENHLAARFHSSEMLLIQTALLVNRLVSPQGVFDLRAIGAVHAAVFLLALALFVPLTKRFSPGYRIALLALALLIFCDVGFSTYYNSFYLDAGAFVFLLLSLVTLWRAVATGRAADMYVAVACAVLLVTAKSQHALLAVPVAIFLVWQRNALWPRRALLAGTLAAIAVLCAGAFSVAKGSPPGYTSPCLFNLIFAKLLPTAKNPQAELADLGLDRSYLQYVYMNAYEDGSPMREPGGVSSFRAKTSFARLCKFYLQHPDRAWYVAKTALGEAALGRPPGIGNYDQSAGRPPYAQSTAFSVWSTARKALLGRSLWAYPLLFAMALAVIARRSPAAAAALFLAAGIEFGIGAMTDALEVTRHLFLFNTIWDLTLFAAVCTLALPRSSQPAKPQAESLEAAELVATGVATE